jgi:hypothetical protein
MLKISPRRLVARRRNGDAPVVMKMWSSRVVRGGGKHGDLGWWGLRGLDLGPFGLDMGLQSPTAVCG